MLIGGTEGSALSAKCGRTHSLQAFGWFPCGTVLSDGIEGFALSSKTPPLFSQAVHLTAVWHCVDRWNRGFSVERKMWTDSFLASIPSVSMWYCVE